MSMDQSSSQRATTAPERVQQRPVPQVIDLRYEGKPLNPEPIDRSLDEVAAQLCRGFAVETSIEPGDGTRYHFVLAPCFNSDSLIDHPIERLLVARLEAWSQKPIQLQMVERPMRAQEFYAAARVLGREQEWTTPLILWWLRKVWARIEQTEKEWGS